MAEVDERERVTRTDLKESKRLFDKGTALFVDVRRPEKYQEAHIPGALSIPVAGPQERYLSLPRDRDIILY